MTEHERLELERAAATKIRNARFAITQSRPFYAVLVNQVETKPSWQFPTMATDSKTHFYNPAFINSIPPAEVEGTCVHESEHDGRHHSTRRKGRDPKKWNEACDYAINGDLIAQGFRLPEGFLFRKEFVGKSAEEIYRILLIEQQQQRPQQPQEGDGDDDTETQEGDGPQGQSSEDDESEDEDSEDEAKGEKPEGEEEGESESGNGDGESEDGESGSESGNGNGTDDESDGESEGNGSGTGGDGEVAEREPYSCGEVLDAPGSDAEKADIDAKWEVVTREAVALAKKKGSLPGHWATLIEQRKTPTQDWRTILREYIDAGARRIETWNRPNRRFVHSGLILPGSQRDGVNKVAFIIDASGSMSGQHVKVANELQAAMDDGAISEAVFIYCDTEVYHVDRFADGDRIELAPIRLGGTDMRPAFELIELDDSDASLIICLTDLEIGEPGPEPVQPTLWMAYGDPRSIYRAQMPWGRIVDVDNE
jgi:predicted metal-dependent peptidase